MSIPLKYLLDLPRYATAGESAIKPGLDRIKELLYLLGNPEKNFRSVLVAGTNGKGSVSSMIAACLSASGMKTGLHTSPHLLHVGERMRVGGEPASERWIEAKLEQHRASFEKVRPSFFEATFALSCLYFSDTEVEIAIIEVGLGGRLDATNILESELAVITNISLEHTDILGDTIGLIAKEKAGIIKAAKPVVVGKLPAEAKQKIADVASQNGALLIDASSGVSFFSDAEGLISFVYNSLELDSVALDLKGEHQVRNASLALCVLHIVAPQTSEYALREGLQSTSTYSGIRGRSDVVARDPLLMVDVAHNPAAMQCAVEAFLDLRPEETRQAYLILGLLEDKDIDGIALVLNNFPLQIIVVDIAAQRGMSGEDLSDRLQKGGLTIVNSGGSLENALDEVKKNDGDCIVTGSHHVVADLLRLARSDLARN